MTWASTILNAPSATSLLSESLKVVRNGSGLLRLFCFDISGNLWYAPQREVSTPLPFHPGFYSSPQLGWGTTLAGKLGSRQILNVWHNLGQPVTVKPLLGFIPTQICAVTNGIGQVEIFFMGSDGIPYHNQENDQGSWLGWHPMPSWPATSLLPITSLYTGSGCIAAALLGNIIVVGYLSGLAGSELTTSATQFMYDYQVLDESLPGSYTWASIANGGLFSFALPANQNIGGLAFQSTDDGLFAYLGVIINDGNYGYFTSTMFRPSDAWTPWDAIPPGSSQLPPVFPVAGLAHLSAAVTYMKNFGNLLIFAANDGSLTFLRQILSQKIANGNYQVMKWNSLYETQLPAKSLGPGIAAAACKDDEYNTQQPSQVTVNVFYVGRDGVTVSYVSYSISATPPPAPTPSSGSLTWPDLYQPSSPKVIGKGLQGPLMSIVSILDKNNKIQVFSVADSTAQTYCWSEF